MSVSIGVDGVPVINGKPSQPCGCEQGHCLSDSIDTLSRWRCPECNAHLAKSGICLNACHLAAASLRRFEAGLAAARAKVGE